MRSALQRSTGHALLDDLGDRAAREGHDRRPAQHRLDHREAKRLLPRDRKGQRDRVAEKAALRRAADLPDQRHLTVVDERPHALVEVRLVVVRLAGEADGEIGGAGCADGRIDALVARVRPWWMTCAVEISGDSACWRALIATKCTRSRRRA
jgi:hypothetical protein